MVRKKCVQKCLFFSLVKKVPPVNNNEQGPSGGAQRKIGNIFIEIFFCHVNRLLVCFLKYLPNRTTIFKEKIVPKKGNFWPKLPPPPMHSAGVC